MQADTFAGANETLNGFDEIVAAIGTRAADSGKPVLLLQGDTWLRSWWTRARPRSSAGNGSPAGGLSGASGRHQRARSSAAA
jgi:hypothetical protein